MLIIGPLNVGKTLNGFVNPGSGLEAITTGPDSAGIE
jgi:hypothetical protein